jgi:hypothetical protein
MSRSGRSWLRQPFVAESVTRNNAGLANGDEQTLPHDAISGKSGRS